MKPIEYTIGPLATPDPDAIAEAQQPAAGGEQDLDLDGVLVSDGVAYLDTPRRVAITSAANDSGRLFTLHGTDRYGNPISETIEGPDTGEVVSQLDYATVTLITVDDDTAGDITVGTNEEASSPWIPVDTFRNPVNIAMMVKVDGAMTWQIEHTLTPVYRSTGPFPVGVHDDLFGKTGDDQGNYQYAISAFRLTLTAYTSGSATLYATQSGLRGA